jgi:hypothetical protein
MSDSCSNAGVVGVLGEAARADDAAALDRRLPAMAHSVCDADPRTLDQRRADALGALAAGRTSLSCACDTPDCPAATDGDAPAGAVVVHVVADTTAVGGTTNTSATADLHGEHPDDDDPALIRTREELAAALAATPPAPDPLPYPAPHPAVIIGGQILPPALLADLIARGAATVRPLIHPGEAAPEPRYRPSVGRVG